MKTKTTTTTTTKIILAVILIATIAGVILIFAKNNKETEKSSEGNATSKNTIDVNNTAIKEENDVIDNTTVESSNRNEEEEKTMYERYAEEQFAEPKEGDTIAIIHVKNYGDITVKFFDDVAPKAVENFVTHSKEGYYNGVTFHRVINEFMIQGGDPLGTGYGGESIWGEGFEEELSEKLLPYRGSLCMASAGTGTSSLGSQFFITQAHYDEETAKILEQYDWPTEIIEMYKKYGGYMSLYQGYTIFGQVIDGMNVVDAIAKTETDSSDKPLENVIIESIEVTTYKK